MRIRLATVAVAFFAASAAAAQPLATGDLVVGDGATLVAVDPVSGEQVIHGVATANVRDVAVDTQRRLLALTVGGSIERFEPAAYDENDPAANRETVGLLVGARGVALDSDGTLLVADDDDDRLMRIAPDDYEAGDPAANQSLVSSNGLLDGPLDVAIDADLDVAYCATQTKVVSIDLAADPGSNQAQVAQNAFVWASLAVLPDGRIAAAGPSIVTRIAPALYNPGMPFANLSPISNGGELQQPTGLAVEASGTVVVPEFSDGDVVRIFPDAYEPGDPPANQDVVTTFDVAPDLHGIAVVPEPGAVALQAVAFASLLGFARSRSQFGSALV